MCDVDSGWPKKPCIRRGLDLPSGRDTFEEACPGQLSIIGNIWHEISYSLSSSSDATCRCQYCSDLLLSLLLLVLLLLLLVLLSCVVRGVTAHRNDVVSEWCHIGVAKCQRQHLRQRQRHSGDRCLRKSGSKCVNSNVRESCHSLHRGRNQPVRQWLYAHHHP